MDGNITLDMQTASHIQALREKVPAAFIANHFLKSVCHLYSNQGVFNDEHTSQPETSPPFDEHQQKISRIQKKMNVQPMYRAPLYRAAGKLIGKKALITGGDSGIGRAVALLYVREGASVAITHLLKNAPMPKKRSSK